jgi:formate-dependent nitrite reductase membrane component NrfD
VAEHFVQAPDWRWYILCYFFIAGVSGGLYTLSTMLRLWGSKRDQAVARMGYLIAFPLAVVCPILLTVDLGQPMRFWHMMVNTTPGEVGLGLKYWSPISLGSWVLLVYGLFAFVSFLEALGILRPLSGGARRVFLAIGTVLALFIASYTGVLLSVSNQPIWSDTWALGGLFLASGLSGSAALLGWLANSRADADSTERRLRQADGYFAVLELLLIAIFFATLAVAGTVGQALAGRWVIIWLLVLASLAPPLAGLVRTHAAAQSEQSFRSSGSTGATAIIVLAGVFLMRLAIIFSAQT